MLLSDIHGSLPCLRRALEFYKAQHCDMLLLMGDILNYGPRNGVPEGLDAPGIANLLNAMADDIVAVRGNCDSEVDQMLLHFPILGTYTVLVHEGRRILLTHGHVYNKENLPPGRFDAVVYGHTHLWELAENDAHCLVCNTGSITFPKGGNPPTLGIMADGAITLYNFDTLQPVATHALPKR